MSVTPLACGECVKRSRHTGLNASVSVGARARAEDRPWHVRGAPGQPQDYGAEAAEEPGCGVRPPERRQEKGTNHRARDHQEQGSAQPGKITLGIEAFPVWTQAKRPKTNEKDDYAARLQV